MVQINQEGIECYTYDQILAGSRMVEAWIKDAIWSRAYILSTVEESPNLPVITSSLGQVAIEFYNILRIYLGDRLAQQFADLMGRRTAIRGDLLTALLRNDQGAADNFTREYYANADAIAAFLGEFPGWTQDVWQNLLYSDNNMYLRQIEAILTSNYDMDISIFNNIIHHSINMGNYMAYGILRRRYE